MANGDDMEQSPRSRGLSLQMILGIGCGVLLLIVGGCFLAGYLFIEQGTSIRLGQYPGEVAGLFENAEKETAVVSKLEQLQDLDVSFLAFGTIENVINAARLDNKISDEEADLLEELLDTIISSNGDISAQDSTKFQGR